MNLLDRFLNVLKLTDPGDDALELLDRAREMLSYGEYRSFLALWIARFYGGELAA